MSPAWDWNKPLADQLAKNWHTQWASLDLPATEKRLERLYWLREFAGQCGPEIPKSWREFLAREIDRGERRQAALVFAEEPIGKRYAGGKSRSECADCGSGSGRA